MPKVRKATHKKITAGYLQGRAEGCYKKGYPVPKWITFCQTLMSEGYEIVLYEARQTVSKYVTVQRGAKRYKVRFSNHKPIERRELAGDCDFFVGVTHHSVTTTEQALVAVRAFFTTQETK